MAADTQRMDWTRLLSTARYGTESTTSDIRSQFQRDIDRITFSDAFRRLARKTQVHPLNENDHIHTRLTHSLEVATVGRSLGEIVGGFLRDNKELPEPFIPSNVGEVVQAACLAHDIGNPPFGHSGEAAIKDWFNANPDTLADIPPRFHADFTKFDGNAMAVRILLSTGFYQQGMSPTLAVVGTLLKYPWPSTFDYGKPKFSYFQTEADAIASIAGDLGLIARGERYARHPLAFLAEAADDICYRIIDIEDATEVGIVSETFMFDAFGDHLGLLDDRERRERYDGYHFRQRNSILRAKLINQATREATTVFRDNYEAIMSGELPPDASLMELAGDSTLKTILTVYKGLEDRLFLSRRKIILELGAQNSLGTILGLTMKEARRICENGKSTDRKKVEILIGESIMETVRPRTDCQYRVMMAIVDYVSGMTDHFATDLCRKFMGLGY